MKKKIIGIFSYRHQNIENLSNDIIRNDDIEKNFNTLNNHKMHHISYDNNNYIKPN